MSFAICLLLLAYVISKCSLGWLVITDSLSPISLSWPEPLVRLLTKDTPFYWGEEQESLFRALIEALATSPCLVHPDFDKPFILFTNASDVAIGAILAQHDENKVDHPIAYYSKTLSKAERNYSVTERECLAVLLAIKHFCPFLDGTHFTVVTNHSSLKWLQQ